MSVFTEAEIELLALLFSPDYIMPRAATLGDGDMVRGAKQAHAEARTMARSYLRSVFERASRRGAPEDDVRFDREFAVNCFRMAERVADLEPMTSRYRGIMAEASRTPWVIYGESPPIPVFDASTEDVRLAVFKATAVMLARYVHLNRAVLPAYGPNTRVWQRLSNEIVVPLQLGVDDLTTVTLVADAPSKCELRARIRRRLKQTLRARRHEYANYGDDCVSEWMRSGFIASYGGAFVSDAGAYAIGTAMPVLVPANGIPLSISINPVRAGSLVLGIAVDHRAFDASHGSDIHAALVELVPQYLKEWER